MSRNQTEATSVFGVSLPRPVASPFALLNIVCVNASVLFKVVVSSASVEKEYLTPSIIALGLLNLSTRLETIYD